jgi:N-glycosylase/DNA lyase
MIDCCVPKGNRILDAIREVCIAMEAQVPARVSWESLPEKVLWRELVGGILGSRATYEQALEAVDALERDGLLDASAFAARPSIYQRRVERTLSGVGGRTTGGTRRTGRYPYPRQRAERIRRSADALYGKKQTVGDLLRQAADPWSARRALTERMCGIGPKQASMFLRNIGYPGEFAVLDTHVLTYMQRVASLVRESPRVQTLREYERTEEVFLDHVHALGLSPQTFDLGVWVVMRVAKRERVLCR